MDDFGELFKSEGRMEALFDHLNQCADKLAKKLYNSKQLVVSGSPKLRWDWRHVRVRGTSGSTGSFSKSYGITQSEFQKQLRAEEEVCRLKMPKVSRAKPPGMKNRSVQSVGWESMMSLVGDMKYWNGPSGRSPVKKRSKVERKGINHKLYNLETKIAQGFRKDQQCRICSIFLFYFRFLNLKSYAKFILYMVVI